MYTLSWYFKGTPAGENMPVIYAFLGAILGHLAPVTAAVEELAKQVVDPPLTHLHLYINVHPSSHNRETTRGAQTLNKQKTETSNTARLIYRTANPRCGISNKWTLP